MNLENFIDAMNQVDDNIVIFQKDKLDIDSEIILIENENGKIEMTIDGVKYFYLLEVFMAKEFIMDWIKGLQFKPTDQEIAQRLFDYAINDA